MICTDSLTTLKELEIDRIALACGVFDGLHVGHQQIMSRLLDAAVETNAAPVVMSFEPHPLAVLKPGSAPRRLLSKTHQQDLLDRIGIEALVLQPFTADLAHMQPDAFVKDLLLAVDIRITAVCVGSNWRFGWQGRGDADLLAELGRSHGFQLIAVDEVRDSRGVVSATRIRQALTAGDLAAAAAMLGRPFSIQGPVQHGKGIGAAELHYPTANIRPQNEVLPPCGIYAATAILQHRRLPAVLYLGRAPTFAEQSPATPILEVHIFDFNEDLYERRLEVEFIEFIRPDEKFDNAAALRRQISRDIRRAKEILAARGGYDFQQPTRT